ncbi:MAG: serine/threonine-protein phosphatase [Chloroflexi bacterium]|nr:serine/threonine-protein phosphatase [Chloroflexota bacterium]
MTAKSLLKRLGIGRGSAHTRTRARSGRHAALTDLGKKRSSNQDQALATVLPDGVLLLAVADGVGGAAGGEIAAAVAVEELAHGFSHGAGDGDVKASLLSAFAQANNRVLATGREIADLEGLATTLVAALVTGSSAWVASVGDSRAYLYEDARGLLPLTKDHTWTADRVREGKMTLEEAAPSPFSHVITRGIGVADSVEPDLHGPIELPPGSVLLLCSDGLHGPVNDQEIAVTIAAGPSEDRAKRLIALANSKGGPDNIAVAIFEAAGD